MSIGFNKEFGIRSLQKRLRGMSDEKLLQFGRDARYMCSPGANLGQPPREVFVIQLEAKLEWKRRHNLVRAASPPTRRKLNKSTVLVRVQL
jgi:hypothetical protein